MTTSPVMKLLEAGVPLSLLLDLAQTAGPDSAAINAVERPPGLGEHLEHLRQHLLGDANPRVGHRDRHPAVPPLGREPDAAAPVGVLVRPGSVPPGRFSTPAGPSTPVGPATD